MPGARPKQTADSIGGNARRISVNELLRRRARGPLVGLPVRQRRSSVRYWDGNRDAGEPALRLFSRRSNTTTIPSPDQSPYPVQRIVKETKGVAYKEMTVGGGTLPATSLSEGLFIGQE